MTTQLAVEISRANLGAMKICLEKRAVSLDADGGF